MNVNGRSCDSYGNNFTVLILTPHGRDAVLAEQTLSRNGLLPHICADLESLRREINIGVGAVLIAEGALAGLDALVSQEPPWSSTPIVVLLGRSGHYRDLAALHWLEHRPNVSFLERPIPKRTLVSTLRAAIEARRLQYIIRDALGAAETASRKKDEFLATLAHELRNPLAPIRSAVYVPAQAERRRRCFQRKGGRAHRYGRATGRPPRAACRRSSRSLANCDRKDHPEEEACRSLQRHPASGRDLRTSYQVRAA